MKNRILIILAGGCLALAPSVSAEQGGSGHYGQGTYLDFSAMPPSQPGFYFANYFLDYANAQISGSKQLPLGGIFAAGVTVNAQAEAPALIYAYPWRPANLTLSSGVYPSWIWEDVKATATFDRNGNQTSGSKAQSTSGFGDIEFTPIMAGWTNGDFSVGAMFNVWAPSGSYKTGQLANPGLGYWTFEAMPAFSWLSSKLGTEFTIYPSVDFNTMNNTTDYKSGDIFHVDATLAQHLPLCGGFVGAGATVSYLKQFTGDSGSGARLGNFKAESLAVGPTISYVHNIGKSILVLDGSWLPQIHSENTTKGNYWWAKLTVKF
jgi:hypothetical protein